MPKSDTAPDLSGFVTTGQVAERYSVTQHEVQRAIRKDLIPAQKVGYFYLIWEGDLPDTWPDN